MGFLDSLLGRTKPVPPKLDALFALPTATVTLQAGMDLVPTGTGSVCFRAPEGRSFHEIEKDVQDLLSMGEGTAKPELTSDNYGFTWLVCHHTPDDIGGLVTDLHAVNTSLVDGGFGPQLLCTLVSLTDDKGRKVGLVYLFKRGTFYPFAPLPGERRDNGLELQVRGQVGADLNIEPDLSRWFAVWGAPGL
ncbi:MAG TPA: hypothetical protein VGS19_16800 [Streptosporangiaceae bacterium]|nr:hypothetical protein [Streptosporangiaceae bacterium]